MCRILIINLFLVLAAVLQAQELVYSDAAGTIRWKKTKQEVSLFGANYCLPSACDFRAAAYMGGERKQMIVEDMEHFKRMNWDGLRLCFWGDFQNTDSEGNLLENEHLDLLDCLIAEAAKRDIYMLLSPIVTYNSQWPEMTDTTNTGLAKYYPKNTLTHDEKAIRAQENYLKQILRHRNPYTGRCLKDEPNILFVEFINEPSQFPEDIPGMVSYIDRLYKAVRSTGCKKLTFYNVSQNFGVAPAIRKSKVQGSTHAWYPGALNNGYSLQGNGLLFVDRYEQMLNPELKGKAKIVYEFDSTDISSGYMYPAMAREFRRGGIQFAAMFSYDMLRTAPTNLGWQTQYFNMVYTPSKAVSGMIAAEVIRRIPRGKHFGYYPENNIFGDFRVSYDEQLSELNADDMFYYSNTTSTRPKNLQALSHIAGVGSSPVVSYSGTGIYFLDKQSDDTWQLEVYPDIMELDDPFKMVNPHRIVRKASCNSRTMKIQLPGLDTVITVLPGKYKLSAGKLISEEELPAKDLYQSPMKEWKVANRTVSEFIAEKQVTFKCEVFAPERPKEVSLYLMLKPWGCKRIPMIAKDGFYYEAQVDLSWLEKGSYQYHYAIETGDDMLLFPAGTHCLPDRWDYYEQDTYAFRLTSATTPLLLLGERDNWKHIRYSRTYLSPETTFKPVSSGEELIPAYQLSVVDLEKKDNYVTPCDATFSHFIGDRMPCRDMGKVSPSFIKIRAYGLNGTDKAICNIVDKDGRGYGAVFQLDRETSDILIPVSSLVPMKAAMLPQDWPGVNSYWYPASMQTNTSPLDWTIAEFIQVSLRDELYNAGNQKNKGIVVEKIELLFQ
ncbi:hypothetical protein [Bacteroides sp. GM023]|uniref:hypothetical protein n=1 Tax=Bacteroides sp. GM023 TaxID=2723058 RepID=UPI00168B8276|nr:hypothetical protein [Bacteroides sp. GM023]MBD3591577.1 hypothetical protein [Bacteroides sp. GM023]